MYVVMEYTDDREGVIDRPLAVASELWLARDYASRHAQLGEWLEQASWEYIMDVEPDHWRLSTGIEGHPFLVVFRTTHVVDLRDLPK